MMYAEGVLQRGGGPFIPAKRLWRTEPTILSESSDRTLQTKPSCPVRDNAGCARCWRPTDRVFCQNRGLGSRGMSKTLQSKLIERTSQQSAGFAYSASASLGSSGPISMIAWRRSVSTRVSRVRRIYVSQIDTERFDIPTNGL